MAIDPDIRLKIIHFFKRNRKFFLVLIIVVVVLIIINRIPILGRNDAKPSTTYTPNIPVIDIDGTAKEVPKKVADKFQDFIEQYVIYCNTGEYVKAYNLISEDCKKNFFSNSYSNFVNYVQQKFDSRKRYAIQNYSNFDGKYIYNVKIFDDFLATGLTNQEYRFQEEKITASYDKDNNIVFSVGNYIQKRDLQYMAANDYLIVNVNSVQEKYSFSIYEIEFTNKSDYTVVIKDGNADGIEVALNVEGEYRACNEDIDIVLEPGEHRKFSLSFSKFYDTDYQIEGLVLSAVRIMENYTGSEESAKQEIENAVDKFSMTVAF